MDVRPLSFEETSARVVADVLSARLSVTPLWESLSVRVREDDNGVGEPPGV